jgi:hypothetical protein
MRVNMTAENLLKRMCTKTALPEIGLLQLIFSTQGVPPVTIYLVGGAASGCAIIHVIA